MVREKLCIVRHEQQRSANLALVAPDAVPRLRRKAIELADANRVIRRQLRVQVLAAQDSVLELRKEAGENRWLGAGVLTFSFRQSFIHGKTVREGKSRFGEAIVALATIPGNCR